MNEIIYKVPVIKQIHSLHLMINEMKKANEEQREELNERKREQEEQKKDFREMEQEQEEQKKELDEIRRANEQQKTEINEIKRVNLEQKKELDKIKQMNAAHKRELNEIKQVNAGQKKELDEMARINAEYKRKITRLEKETITRNEWNKVLYEIRKEIHYEFFRGLPVEKYKEALCEWFYFHTGKRLNIEEPRTFNEKIQWMKLYDSTPIKTKLTDKVAVRGWVRQMVGEQHLIPCLGVWNRFGEIDFDTLPDKFVLKANHGCGWNVIVRDKRDFDKKEAEKKFHDWLSRNYAWYGLELQYKNIPPKIYAEEYLENVHDDLYDYKFLCFDGQIQHIWVITERYAKMRMTIFDSEWNRQNYSIGWPQSEKKIPKPDLFEEMKIIAQKLSKGFSFVRVDLYNIGKKIYFGEMTFTSGDGKYTFEPEEYDAILGEMITLPEIQV